MQDSNLRRHTPTDLQPGDAHALTSTFAAIRRDLRRISPRSQHQRCTSLPLGCPSPSRRLAPVNAASLVAQNGARRKPPTRVAPVHAVFILRRNAWYVPSGEPDSPCSSRQAPRWRSAISRSRRTHGVKGSAETSSLTSASTHESTASAPSTFGSSTPTSGRAIGLYERGGWLRTDDLKSHIQARRIERRLVYRVQGLAGPAELRQPRGTERTDGRDEAGRAAQMKSATMRSSRYPPRPSASIHQAADVGRIETTRERDVPTWWRPTRPRWRSRRRGFRPRLGHGRSFGVAGR